MFTIIGFFIIFSRKMESVSVVFFTYFVQRSIQLITDITRMYSCNLLWIDFMKATNERGITFVMVNFASSFSRKIHHNCLLNNINASSLTSECTVIVFNSINSQYLYTQHTTTHYRYTCFLRATVINIDRVRL